jgi:hypothetical protein
VQSDHAIVQDENVIVQSVQAVEAVQAENDNAIVPFVSENSIVVTSPTKPTKEIILQESPIRLTRG